MLLETSPDGFTNAPIERQLSSAIVMAQNGFGIEISFNNKGYSKLNVVDNFSGTVSIKQNAKNNESHKCGCYMDGTVNLKTPQFGGYMPKSNPSLWTITKEFDKQLKSFNLDKLNHRCDDKEINDTDK